MPSVKLARYRLTPRARSDLESIWSYSAETWSVEQAEAYVRDLTKIFGMIVAIPGMGQEYRAFSKPVRTHIHRSQVIIYMVEDDHVLIVRILGGKQDWRAILERIDA